MTEAPPKVPRAIEDIVIAALTEFLKEQSEAFVARQLKQAQEIDARLDAHLRMMKRLASTTRQAMQILEERLTAQDARIAELEEAAQRRDAPLH